MWIRYLASIDDTEHGRVALEYLKGILRHAPVRLLPQTAPPSAAWAPYVAHLLARPPSGGPEFVNVVCTPSERWTWTQSVAAPTRKGTPEIIRGRLELLTAGVRNVLIALAPPSDPHQIETAQRYDAVIIRDAASTEAWQRIGITPHALPPQTLQGGLRAACIFTIGVHHATDL